MNQQVERINIREMASAMCALPGSASERWHLDGKYEWRMHIPAPHHLDGFIELRDRIAAVERLPILVRTPQLEELSRLKKMLAQIPQEEQWRETNHNLVVTIGGNDALDKYLAGSAYTAAFYMGLISATGYTTGVALADTMASHAGWAEDVNYANATRIAAAWSAASAKSKSLSAPLVFNINATTTLKGSFMTTVSTKGGATGILLSGGTFAAGDQPAINGNTLSGSYSLAV